MCVLKNGGSMPTQADNGKHRDLQLQRRDLQSRLALYKSVAQRCACVAHRGIHGGQHRFSNLSGIALRVPNLRALPRETEGWELADCHDPASSLPDDRNPRLPPSRGIGADQGPSGDPSLV
jgi:hypothetical protein